MDWHRVLTEAASAPIWAWPVLAGGVVALLVLRAVARAIRRRRPAPAEVRSRRAETALTVGVAGIATATSATGMWKFFGDTMDTHGLTRVVLFGFIELALLVSALRDRRWRLRHKQIGVDGYAVWVLAALTGLLAATDTHSVPAGLMRLAAPLVAAWLWERLLVGELDDQAEALRRQQREAEGPPRRIAWRIRPERVLVWLRLAEPTGREVEEVDRARRLAALARAAYHLHTLPSGAKPRTVTRAQRRLRRLTIAAAEHIDLAGDVSVRTELREYLATLYQAETGTAPDAVRDLSPWSAPAPAVSVDDAEPVSVDRAEPVPAWLDDPWTEFGTPVDDAPVSPAVQAPVPAPAVQAPQPVPVQPAPAPRTDTPAARIEVPPAPVKQRATATDTATSRTESDDELLPAVRPVVEELAEKLGRAPGGQKLREAFAGLEPPVKVSPNRALRLRDAVLNTTTVDASAS